MREAVGPCSIRVASADAGETTRVRLRRSFARGDVATWGYDEARAARAVDARTVLESARSVICVAIAYATREPVRAPLEGRVSCYAWSLDYHRTLVAMLEKAAAGIDAYAGAHVTAVVCDTKPLAERAFAAGAGLGWVGKHTNLITPEAGSFAFLGEIVTALELASDAPLRKDCGRCTRCVDACPTGALRGDYTIDATRCISDLTQRTDGIPRPMRALVGTWVWGCDLCQWVCPPTQRAAIAGGPAFEPVSRRTAAPDLMSLLRLRSGEYRRDYEPTAMGWRGAAVLRRNAAVALGNLLDRAAVPALADALEHDPHPMVRGHVAWALGRIGSPPAIGALRTRRPKEGDPGVREEIDAAMTAQA